MDGSYGLADAVLRSLDPVTANAISARPLQSTANTKRTDDSSSDATASEGPSRSPVLLSDHLKEASACPSMTFLSQKVHMVHTSAQY